MSGFCHQSILELDYCVASDLMTWDELDDDRSVARAPRGPRGPPADDYAPAADIYQGVLGRWAEIRSREILELAARRPYGVARAESNCRHRGFQPRALPI